MLSLSLIIACLKLKLFMFKCYSKPEISFRVVLRLSFPWLYLFRSAYHRFSISFLTVALFGVIESVANFPVL